MATEQGRPTTISALDNLVANLTVEFWQPLEIAMLCLSAAITAKDGLEAPVIESYVEELAAVMASRSKPLFIYLFIFGLFCIVGCLLLVLCVHIAR